MWSLGDYEQLAHWLEPAALTLADACDIRPGMGVLDVAAGNGNFALAAARRGATVVASDLTPHMIELGRERLTQAGMGARWVEANAEELPFETATFDVAASVFGAMFAFHPDRVASELVRVVRPGGLVAMANYSTAGFLGAMGKLLDSLRRSEGTAPASPFLWGDPGEVRRRFASLPVTVHTEQRTDAFTFPSLHDGWAFWERTNPPQSALKSMLPPETYAAVARRARALMADMNQATDGTLRLEWDWLLVLARKGLATR
jgi:SAM-dependent methyltransferase